MINHGNSLQAFGRPRRSRLRYIAPLLLAVPILAAAALAVVTVSSHPTITVGRDSLAQVSLPFGGGTIERVSAVGAPQQSVVPVQVRGDQIWPQGKLPAGQRVTIEVTVKRPGWISWLSGSTEQIKLTETTPVVQLTSKFVTRHRGQPITLHFDSPAAVVAYGPPGSRPTHQQTLPSPQTTYQLSEHATAGTLTVAVAARTWERLKPVDVSWFPAGTKATAVATPTPGSQITPATEITLTFSKPVAKALGSHLPPVSPATQGAWHRLNAHTIRFQPSGYGYGLGAHVAIDLPAGINLVGGQPHGADPVGRWTVPGGSALRLQQLLAQLGYLPVDFKQSGTPVANTIGAQEAAAVSAPKGSFGWRYGNTPSALRAMWAPGQWGELMKGAVMSFEENQGLAADGVPGPAVWKALIQAEIKGQKSTFGYTFVHVSESLPENVQVWHNGRIVVSGPVNTGIAAAPTATGTFAVYEHIPVGTMSGTNPDGSTYHDPGIPWISYFNGGDALHGFIRASYGFPQSLGCVEMPFSEAGKVYPYTPIGTIVDVVP